MNSISSIVVIVLQIGAITAQFCSPPSCGGSLLDLQNCQCSGSTTVSTCPTGATPVNVQGRCSCQFTTQPQCGAGFSLRGSNCQCVKENIQRLCPSGATLSSDGCKCSRLTQSPTCSNGCQFIPSSCSCQSLGVTCFQSTICSGGGFLTFSAEDCCRGSFGSAGSSYRFGNNGPCIQCSRFR